MDPLRAIWIEHGSEAPTILRPPRRWVDCYSIGAFVCGPRVFFDVKVELVLRVEYSPVIIHQISISTTRTWYGDRVVNDPEAENPRPYRPRARMEPDFW